MDEKHKRQILEQLRKISVELVGGLGREVSAANDDLAEQVRQLRLELGHLNEALAELRRATAAAPSGAEPPSTPSRQGLN
jgi:hypothetical protein